MTRAGRGRGRRGEPAELLQISFWREQVATHGEREGTTVPGGVEALLAGLNPEQKRAVTHGEGPLLVVAGAGTGKTQVVTRRIAWLIATRRARPSEILALTFTDKAAEEMQARVDRLVPYGYTDTVISTFHAFGDRLIREHALELGLPTDPRVLSRPESVIFLAERLFRLDLDEYRPQIGRINFDVAFYFDRLAAVMTLVVTGVGSVIHVYSVGYMAHDKSFGRFFAYLNLFLFFMLLLVLGRSMLVLFVGWEGVGLASYLLIGFWFDDAANARAGKKAFVVNRIGDAGFLLGMFVLWQAFGTLNMDRINEAFGIGAAAVVPASLVGILLFIGATGKSAQIPLHVWLPDAMAGPTPVSALIHAATMVTAGVYLVARMSGLYLQAPEASMVIAVIGAATAFFAATIAIVQTDIKKVLAYSTVSQLGFMFLALGVGAYGVAIFHVVTHAFFKACLFLGAGSVIHALGGEQDIRKMGGLRNKIPLTFWTFAIATAAIAGFWPLAGFWSKDEIIWFALASERGGSVWLWALATLTALMTAFYMFRLLWLTFFGASRMSAEVEHHVHESPPSMTGVLVLLAALSALGGFISIPHFLEPMLPLPATSAALHHLETPLKYLAMAIATAGVLGAWFFFGNGARRAATVARSAAGVHRWLTNKYYIDELYEWLIGRPLVWLSDAVFLRLGDRRILDGTLDGLAAMGQRSAGVLGRVQTGSLHLYAWLVLMGIVGALLWSWRHV